MEGELSFLGEKFSKLLPAGLVVSVHSFNYLLYTYVANTILGTRYTSVYKKDKTLYPLRTKILEEKTISCTVFGYYAMVT